MPQLNLNFTDIPIPETHLWEQFETSKDAPSSRSSHVSDGVYHPALFNDRLLLGLKGTMSEAELHIIRARLDGGIRNKAARGELRRGLPVGYVWGEKDGEVLFHPDEAVTGAVRTVFERFAEFGSARRVWLWFRSEGLSFPLQTTPGRLPSPIRWVVPTYTALHHILSNPVYAGAYTYGKTKCERYLDEHGAVRKRSRHLPIDQWSVLIQDHHPGFIDWSTYHANQARLDSNTRPRPHQAGGAVREGSALLQGLVTCGHCGRRLHVHYRGRNSAPGYHCAGKDLVAGRGVYCLNVGGMVIEQAVAEAYIDAITPAAIEAMRLSVEQPPPDFLHQLFANGRAFGYLFRHARFGPFLRLLQGFTLRAVREGQFYLVFLPLFAHESVVPTHRSIYPLTGTVQAFDDLRRLLRPLLTSVRRSGSLPSLSPDSETDARSPEVSLIAFGTQPPDLRPAPLMDMDFAVTRLLVRHVRLISGSCSSARAFAPRFFQTVPRDDALALR